MELDVTFFAIAVPAILFSAVSKSGFGSGAAFASAPILALIVPPAQAVGLMLPILMTIDLASLGPFWKKWDARIVRRLIIGSIPGVALGVAVFGLANPDHLRVLIGGVAVAFVLHRLAIRLRLIGVRAKPYPAPVGFLAGGAAGFFSFVSHAGGPPTAMYLLAERLDKTTFQASTVLFFWALNLIKFPPYAALGMFSREAFIAALLLAPVAVIGARLGVWAHRKVPEKAFFAVTYVLLTLAGSKLIWDGLTGG